MEEQLVDNKQKHKSTAQIICFTLNAVLGGIVFGYTMGVLNNAQDTLNIVFKIAGKSNLSLITGFISSITMVGAALGAFLTGTLLNYMGRRQCLMLADALGIIFSALFLVSNLWTCMIARFLIGIVVGINSALVPLYIKEMSPIAISGLTGSFNQTSITVGVVTSYCVGLGFGIPPPLDPNHLFWRMVLILPVIPCLIRLLMLTLIITHDTPSYLVEANKMDEAQAQLQKMYHPQYVEEQMLTIQQEIQSKKANVQTYGLQFSPQYRKRTVVGMMAQVFQQVSGINALVLFSSSIFESIAKGSKDHQKEVARIYTIFAGLALVISPMLTGVLLNKFGRKTILLQGEALLIFFCFFLGIMSTVYSDTSKMPDTISYFMVACIILYNFSFGYTLGPVVWIYCADILTEKGISISTTTNWLSSFIVCLIAPELLDAIGVNGLFFIFGGCCILGLAYFWFFLMETKGKTPKEIEDMFAGGKRGDNKQLISTTSEE